MILFYMSLLLIVSLLFEKLAKLFHLLSVSGCLLGDLFLGPIIGPLITKKALTNEGEITPDVAKQKMSH